MSTRPVQLLGVPGGTLEVGAVADVTLIDPEAEWTVDAQKMHSKSRNTPFDGWPVRGRAVMTIVGGEVCYRVESG
jgi:dihydroorotase